MSARWSFDSVGIGNEIRNAITTELTRSILSVQSALREMLSKTGSGVGFIGGRKGKGSFRTRSSPGEPPAVDTGHLRQTVAVARVQTVSTPALVRVGLAEFAPYGKWLEGGTKPSTKTRAARKSTQKQQLPPAMRKAAHKFRLAIAKTRASKLAKGMKAVEATRAAFIGPQAAKPSSSGFHIAPRPWIKPTLDAQRPVIVAAISQAVDRATAQFRGRR